MTTATDTRSPNARERLGTFINYCTRQPGLDYLMIRIVVLVLVGLGVVMAFSSSMTWSVAGGETVFSSALRQTGMVAVGLVLFWVALKTPMRLVRKSAVWLLLLSIALLVAVLTPLGSGREEVGSQSWFIIGPLSLQPSELARITIVLWGATYLAGARHVRTRLSSRFVHFMGVAGFMFILIGLQGDLGMALSFAVVSGFTLLFAGVKLWIILVALAVTAVSMVGVFLGGGFRSARFHTYFDALFGNITETQSTGFQTYQGYLSLADGSLAGVGLGQSRAKWFYLPEAKNDFIFAIIGEELGLWGGALVIGLFALLGAFGLRAALRAQNQFQALLAAGLTMGVVSQAFINISYVIGLLPVTGVQLPMISAGGTSAIITIGTMGLLASVARHEPEAISAMQNYGRPLFDRLLGIGEPVPDKDTSFDAPRRAEETPRRHAAPRERRATPVTARTSATRRAGSVDTSRRTSARETSRRGAEYRYPRRPQTDTARGRRR
ncbi:cell division protein [Corynebacterium yudongzhengii]|uniref:Probable peptidoglycan glycosyltransferase FtsW n=1 Tax=Corynebacterium yudongzhengii TaxID=2080740 RepID=A0A2U1T789_9CORY|nr:putative peptidoglycan glycosyltransferase FtsW [Corynebacterium yudongzhengii]AWB81571.1 cell division protein [Corynebacterium yudongzhengii]PWC01859.1 cell division protein [Corynebacterium yudongzhengii]